MSIYIVRMSNPVTESTAEAVRSALADAQRSKQSLSDETGIPYSTLNRKLAAKTEFTFSELYAIASALGVSPAVLVPVQFRANAA